MIKFDRYVAITRPGRWGKSAAQSSDFCAGYANLFAAR
jgi:hypothetical protein